MIIKIPLRKCPMSPWDTVENTGGVCLFALFVVYLMTLFSNLHYIAPELNDDK
jgi:hypothetical protein